MMLYIYSKNETNQVLVQTLEGTNIVKDSQDSLVEVMCIKRYDETPDKRIPDSLVSFLYYHTFVFSLTFLL